MGPLGFPEMVVIFVIALLVFGPRKLPELGRSLGKGLSEFKRASNDLRNTLDDEIRTEERRAAVKSPPPAERPDSPAVETTDEPSVEPSASDVSAPTAEETSAPENPTASETVARDPHTV